MTATPLYQQIAEAFRQQIVSGELRPGDGLPPVRRTAEQWGCTPGTAQRAYQELARHGLVRGRQGQGTRVVAAEAVAQSALDASGLRQAGLVHRAEAFLLDALAGGFEPGEVEKALRAALDRWRAVARPAPAAPAKRWRFSGSHDPALGMIAARFADLAPGFDLQVRYTGSLGGLMALAQGDADMAGLHLWDAEGDDYNLPFVRRLFPGQSVALVTLAHRRLGLLVPTGNPLHLTAPDHLAWPGVAYANRPRGTGTRVWLDAQLACANVQPDSIAGYHRELPTHSAVAEAIVAGEANAGLGVEAAALAFGLDFVPLTLERYELAVPAAAVAERPMGELVAWLAGAAGREAIAGLGGYVTGQSGRVRTVAGL